MSTSLARIDAVDGWQVYRDDEAEHWMRDLDVALRAGLAKPRDIRTTIRKALKDGALQDWRRHAGANETAAKPAQDWRALAGANPSAGIGARMRAPMFRAVLAEVTSGKGRRQTVPEYYLNRAAVVVILARLRTDAAEQAVSTAIIGSMSAFDALERGAPPSPITVEALEAMLEKRIAPLREQFSGLQALVLAGIGLSTQRAARNRRVIQPKKTWVTSSQSLEKKFDTWCADRGLRTLPAEIDTIVGHMEWRREKGHTPGTIEQALRIIDKAHRDAGYDSPRKDPRVQRALAHAYAERAGSEAQRAEKAV